MRLLYTSGRPPYPLFLGGAARCAHRLLLALASGLGAQCRAAGDAGYASSPWSYPDRSRWPALGVQSVSRNTSGSVIDCGYPVHLLADFPDELGELIDSFRPDVVWAQLEGARDILELAQGKGAQGLLYVHDAETDPAELRAIAGLGVHLVCSSAFLAERVRRLTGRRAHVVYPAPELFFDSSAHPGGCVTMVNPHPVKGIDTFLELARRFPADRFMVVESWKLTEDALTALNERLASSPNVKLRRRVADMREVYRETRLLLVPSVWEEGFGMVALEAQSCGIPVIASDRGGLPEAVGDGGVLVRDYRNADAWVDAIQTVSKDYAAFSGRASSHAASEEFAAPSSARRFYDVCNSKPAAFPRLGQMLRLFAR
jgi:glycosyltransferase involved in cell wall biosynthesis